MSSTDGNNFLLRLSTDDDDNDSEFEILVQAYMRDVYYCSKNQAIMSVVYATLNAGLVSLPFVAQQVGIPIFVCAIAVMSLASGYTTCLIIQLANAHGGE